MAVGLVLAGRCVVTRGVRVEVSEAPVGYTPVGVTVTVTVAVSVRVIAWLPPAVY